MKINLEIEIDATPDRVADVFSDPEKAKNWHPDLISISPLEGPPGEVGSTAVLKFPKFDLHETITSNKLPYEFSGEYLAEGICWNSMTNTFKPIGEKTLYQVEVEYRMISWFIKLMAWTMPWAFKKQVYKSMVLMKNYIESNEA